MRSLIVATLSLLAIRAVSACACLSEETAYGVADNYQHLFQNYTKKFAQSALSPNYTDQTDSVAWLINNGTECPHPVRRRLLLNAGICSSIDNELHSSGA